MRASSPVRRCRSACRDSPISTPNLFLSHAWRVFETRDDYFDYYRGYHALWKLYGIDLPDSVPKKVYFGNALRITARLPRGGWPR